jgi:hypothetical protein
MDWIKVDIMTVDIISVDMPGVDEITYVTSKGSRFAASLCLKIIALPTRKM